MFAIVEKLFTLISIGIRVSDPSEARIYQKILFSGHLGVGTTRAVFRGTSPVPD